MLSRRSLLMSASAVAATGALSAARAASATAPTLATTLGSVRGLQEDGGLAFLGIPYGASTSGAGRFMPPRPAQPWTGVLEAVAYGPDAPQRRPGAPAGQRPWPSVEESEDCLRLNIWTPAAQGRRPVMVWLHGGGFVSGSASAPRENGAELAAGTDVVVVSLNHRLSVLGHAFLERMDPAFAGSGNAGLLDIVLALRWVRDNIARFGGDPGNVTLFGQSGGGQKICMLMGMPPARGLFHRAIVESGQAPRALEADYADGMARALLAALGLGPGAVRQLQYVPLSRLLTAYHDVYARHGGDGTMGIVQGFVPVVDGSVLPRHPFGDGPPPEAAGVPLIIGSTRTEMSQYAIGADPTLPTMSEEALVPRLRPMFGDAAPAIVRGYRRNHPSLSPWETYLLITADWPTRIGSIEVAEKQARQAAVFMYRIDWETPVEGGRLHSPHAIEISMVFRNLESAVAMTGGGPRVRRLSDLMSSSWASFARGGTPDAEGLPAWPRYEPTRRATMIFDDAPFVADDPGGADREILTPLWNVMQVSPAARHGLQQSA